MSVIDRLVRRTAPALGLALGVLVASTPPASAQSPELYGLNSSGLVSVNATEIDDLPGSSWVSLVVDGSDRYALNKDGKVYKNGVELYKLECLDNDDDEIDVGDWVGLVLSDGSLWALSQFGYMAQDGVCVAQLGFNGFLFTDLFTGPTGTWSMRADGAVFANTTFANLYAFTAGAGLEGAGEGVGLDTMWESGVVGPDAKPYGLRRDGKLVRGDLLMGQDPSQGTVIASLPFGTTATSTTLYVDIAFTEAGDWIALRGNGELYQEGNTLTPLIEFSGSSPAYVDLLPLPASVDYGTTDMSFFALQGDGRLYRETGEDDIGELPKSKYCCLALSSDPPDLTNIDNAKPVVAKYTTTAISGESITVPVLATDTDLASEDLVITVDTVKSPEGTAAPEYDDLTRTITWADPLKGSASVTLLVNDGVNKPVKVSYSIKAKDPDTNVDSNKSPTVSKIKGVQGLVGIPLELPILAVDVDGDPLTITVDDTLAPFTLGATFDDNTNTFIWSDPQLKNIGEYKLQFNVSDGIKTVKLSVTVEIVSSLLGI